MSNIQQFDYSVNLLKTLLWQYNKAKNLQSLLIQKQAWYDENQTQFWEDWYNNVFNLQTANEFGLAVWAIILGMPLNLIVAPNTSTPFGFELYNENFNNGNFANTESSVVSLTLDEQRLILQLRYFQLTCNGTVPEINKFLKFIFQQKFGTVYVLDGLNMTCEYIFTFTPGAGLQAALENLDLLPRPAGVKITITIDNGAIFGFGIYNQNFGNGNFF